MHDVTFAARIIALLKKELSKQVKVNKVKVNIILGPFTHVSFESLRSAFEVLNEKEGIKNVVLDIKSEKAVIRCNKCGVLTEISEPVATCPKCDCGDFQIENAEEFVIQSIEIE
jgi:hydrogenase nickel insertion protein HypA